MADKTAMEGVAVDAIGLAEKLSNQVKSLQEVLRVVRSYGGHETHCRALSEGGDQTAGRVCTCGWVKANAQANQVLNATGPRRQCRRCSGTGIVNFEVTHHGERNEPGTETCQDCKGQGTVPADFDSPYNQLKLDKAGWYDRVAPRFGAEPPRSSIEPGQDGGWQLVPKKATEVQMTAGKAASRHINEYGARDIYEAMVAAAPAIQQEGRPINDKAQRVEAMVGRFLSWRLPENFQPDGGIVFKKYSNPGTPYQHEYQPTGTNLFDATQARQMIEYLLGVT